LATFLNKAELTFLRLVEFSNFIYRRIKKLNSKELFELYYTFESRLALSTISKKSKNKDKYKLLLILLYPYVQIFWKILFSKIIIKLIEFSLTVLDITHQRDAFTNLFYHWLINNHNSNANYFSFWDVLNLFLFLLPNSILLIYTHFKNSIPSFLLQNLSLLNLFGFYINGNLDLSILGGVNILILLNLLAADKETYENFSLWFDAFGITSHL
jgi:hypothetical protein